MKNNSINGNNANNNMGGFIMATGTMDTLEVFADTVRAALDEHYGEGYCIEVMKVTKTNDVKLTGISIKETGCNIAPTIYLNQVFEDYLKGRPVSDILKEIIAVYDKNRVHEGFNVERIMDFEQVKDRLCMKLINSDRNKVFLSEVPSVPFHDLAVVFYILVNRDGSNMATVTVRNEMAAAWGVDADALYDIALKNSPVLMKGRVSSMMSVLSEFMDLGNPDMMYDMDISGNEAMYVASNSDRVNGSAVILYPGLLKDFADKIGTPFFILPSSIHECLFVPADERVSADVLRQMVHEVNEAEVAPDEVLSDSVYYYDPETDIFEIA